MTGAFDRDRLREPVCYFESEGLVLIGRGKWRTTRCDIHGGSDSLRVNTATGAWRCMACHAKGGDILAFHMQRHGLDFIDAARALGAWDEGATKHAHPMRLRRFSARDALEVVELELNVCMVVISDARRGQLPNDADWRRFLQAAGIVGAVAMEARS